MASRPRTIGDSCVLNRKIDLETSLLSPVPETSKGSENWRPNRDLRKSGLDA